MIDVSAGETVIEVGDGDTITIVEGQTIEVGGGELISTGGGPSIHNDLAGRSTAGAHPISAITGLQDALDSAGAVSSVNGQTGAVVLDAGDVGAATPAEVAAAVAALGKPVAVGLMDGETAALLAFLPIVTPALVGETVLTYDGADATLGTLTVGGTLADPVDLFDGEHDLSLLTISASLRNLGGSVRYGERWHVQPPATIADSYALVWDEMIDVRIFDHEGRPHAHRLTIVENQTLLDDTARRAVDEAFFDGTMGVAQVGADLCTFAAASGGTVVSKVVGGALGVDPVLVTKTGTGAESHDTAMVDVEGGLYVSFTHALAGDGTSYMGIATWDGNTSNSFVVLGSAVTPNIGIGNGGAANNIGSFTPVIHFGDYLYAFHRDQLADGTIIKLAVSRVNRAAMFAAAALGNVEAWSKWDGTGWSEPGLGGAPADVAPAGWVHTHANVAQIDETGELVLFGTSSGTPLFASYSSDGVTWSTPVGAEDRHADVRDDYATLYSGDPTRPNVLVRGDRAVLWTARCALGDTPLTDETWIIEQLLCGWGIDGAAGGGGTVDVVSNVATDRVLGRVSSGSGDSEELTGAQVLTLAGGVPTSRTLAGLDLTANRSAADVRSALDLGRGNLPFSFAVNDYWRLTAGYGTGRLANAAWGAIASNSNSTVAYTPFYVARTVKTTTLALEITTGNAGASAVLRMGLYSDNAGRPGTVLAQSTITINGTGIKEVTFAEVTLTPGFYWAAAAPQSLDTGGTNPACAVPAAGSDAVGETAPAASTSSTVFLRSSGVTGAFGDNPTVTHTRNTLPVVPSVYMKVTALP